MARYTVSHPLVRQLINEMLIPGYLATGTIAALTRALNDALVKVEVDGTVHVNRIHALLSEDVARGVNQSTVDLLSSIFSANPWSDDLDESTLSEFRNRATPHLQAGLDVSAIADLVGVPAAILARAVRGTSTVSKGARVALEGPDWSFQDVAVERCIAAFEQSPKINVGLVLPTGAGKTRTALRIVLERLAVSPSSEFRAVWATHRHNLKAQAFRELGKLIDQAPPGLPANAQALAERIDFAMLSEVPAMLNQRTSIVIVDEAHHAAAPSYRPIFEKKTAYPVLLLTATPVRMDEKPIFIDQIAFTITYRELAERHAIIVPDFEPLKVASLDLSDPEIVNQVAHRVVDETAGRFRKTLVIASRIEHVESIYARVLQLLDTREGHPVGPADVGFIHGRGNSHELGQEALLALFAEKPHAILVSAQMLLEGFDDPAIDSVVITYRTDSIITLMQAAGRCVRHAPGKRQAWVVQVDNPALAYRFDQRWLYEDISDRPRPFLIDLDYSSREELEASIDELLAAHNVAVENVRRVKTSLTDIELEEEPRLMLFGLPYFGKTSKFREAPWGAFLETKANTRLFRALFNQYCEIKHDRPDAREFVDSFGPTVGLEPEAKRLRRDLIEVLGALGFALDETDDRPGSALGNRDYHQNAATTFLRYAISHYRSRLSSELEEFLSDCHNRATIAAAYTEDSAWAALAMKVPMPIGGFEARLLSNDDAEVFIEWLDTLADALRAVEPSRQLSRLTVLRSEIPSPPLPPLHLDRTEGMIAEAGRKSLILDLKKLQEQQS